MGIIITGLVLVLGGAAGIYVGYSNSDWALSGIGWAALLVGAIGTLFGFGKRASDRVETPSHEQSDAAHAEVRALIQSMGVVAVADAKIRDQEVAAISEIHEQMLGVSISAKEVREILSEFDQNFNITERLTAKRGQISPAMKRTIVQACHLVMVSDLEVVEREEDRVNQIGLALGFDQSEIEDLIASAGT